MPFGKPPNPVGHTYKLNGYIWEKVSLDHPFLRQRSSNGAYMLQHRLIMERKLNRYLTPKEIIHHKNHKRDDNRIENLQVVTRRTHLLIHYAGKVTNLNDWEDALITFRENCEIGLLHYNSIL